ncbi:hypothetical protein [Actinoplanes awajinensis]|uniref:hypothetical protein n=1 Tax=Actinoplanes awajinensis TaxID=135946 RepID=UPI0012FBE69D|nr:hypothetical protein [Actinoplanes awajinensis]
MTPGELDRFLMTMEGAPPALATVVERLAGPPAPEIERCAAGPLAPLLCATLIQQLAEPGGSAPDEGVTAVLRGLAQQQSALALLDVTDELLGSGAFVESYGTRLHRVFLTGASTPRPLVAATFAEGALRLAIAGSGDIMRTVVMLTPEEADGLDPDYAERLPRLLGAALDVWGAERAVSGALLRTLAELRLHPAAAAGAAFETGLHQIRSAADPGTDDPVAVLVTARKNLAHAEAAEECGGDAALYGTGIDAVMAFRRGDQLALRDVHRGLLRLLDERANGFRRGHVPAWRRSRAEAGFAWARLVTILTRALDATTRPAWLDAWPMIDALLDAYALDRAVVPVPGAVDQDGLARVVRPVIASALRGRETLLVQLRVAAVDDADRVGRLREIVERPDTSTEASPDDDADCSRLVSLAPSIVAELGLPAATRLARQVDDDALRMMEGMAYNTVVRHGSLRDPVIAGLLDSLVTGLQPCADYTGSVRQSFDALLAETVTFLATRHDLQRSAAVDYLSPARPPPREARLQDDFADWLRRGPLAGRIAVEVPNVATGRADIMIGFGVTRFFIEVKRELRNSSRAELERAYLAQAADYSGTSATLGMLLVLDLTPHPAGVPHLSECAWVTSCRPPGSTVDRYIVVGRVIGNRSTPSAYSRAAGH